MCAVWIDLLDPSRQELKEATPADLHPRAIELLNRESRHGDEPRPTLESHGDYVFGLFLVPRPSRRIAPSPIARSTWS